MGGPQELIHRQHALQHKAGVGQHADEAVGVLAERCGVGVGGGPRHQASGRHFDVTETDGVTGPLLDERMKKRVFMRQAPDSTALDRKSVV